MPSLLKSHQNIHNSVKFEVVWKWHLMPIRKVHWVSASASISGDKSIRQANDVEENPGPTIFDIIDPTITVSADSSFVKTVTELKTKILTAFENETRVSFLLIVNPFTPKSDLIDFTLSNARQFCSSKGDPLGVKGLKNYLP